MALATTSIAIARSIPRARRRERWAPCAAVEELRQRFFREMRALVASSQRAQRVAVANVQLFAIDVG